MNEATVRTLRSIQHVLPIPVDKMLGRSIDMFHKDPSHQRRMLSDVKNLPHKARITVGGEVLDLLVTPLTNAAGRYVAPMLVWELVTEKVRLENEQARLTKMLDDLPIPIMTCDPDLTINYINKKSVELLRTLQNLLPVSADNMLGQSIDVFHKNPSHQRRMLGDPRNLPHRGQDQTRLGNAGSADLRTDRSEWKAVRDDAVLEYHHQLGQAGR